MEMRNCSRCRQPYIYNGNPFCSECREGEHEDFQQVKDFLGENPGAGVEEIHEETGVDRDLILYFLREGRLEVAAESGLGSKCQVCKKPIPEGRICQACVHQLRQPLADKQKQDRDERRRGESARLFIQDRLDKKKENR